METKKVNLLRSAGLCSYGLEFRQTAVDALDLYKKKNPSNPINPGYAPFAIYFNFLHGIELGLKSYLVHKAGMREEELRTKFGHNLDRLLEVAFRHDLQTACTELTDTDIQTISSLSEHYSSKKFEYIWMDGSLEMFDIEEVAKATDNLIFGVEDLVRKPWEALSGSEKERAKQEALSDSKEKRAK